MSVSLVAPLFVKPEYRKGNFCVYNVRAYKEREAYIAELFKNRVEPLYGPQDVELKEMWYGTKVKTRVLCKENVPVGVIVFNNDLTRDTILGETLVIRNFFYVKGLLAEKRMHDYFHQMIQYVQSFAEKRFGYVPNFSFRLGSQLSPLLHVYKHYGFEVVKTVDNGYWEGMKELFLRVDNVPSVKGA